MSNLTTTPFYFFVSDGESKIRANEELTESLVTGTFASTDAADSLTATTAEAPIDSFWIGKVNEWYCDAGGKPHLSHKGKQRYTSLIMNAFNQYY